MSTTTVEIADLRDDALEVEPVSVDGWSETYGETWEYVEAPDCSECGDYARWDDDGHEWRCQTDGCENNGREVEDDGGGPMMNYHYPLDSLGIADNEYEAADLIRDLPLCVVVWLDGGAPYSEMAPYSLALTGGGMDFSWEICAAFIRLGFLPPAHFADLPGMAGHPRDDEQIQTVRACIESLRQTGARLARRAGARNAEADRLAERYGLPRE